MSDYENVQTFQFSGDPQGNRSGSSLSRPGGVLEYNVSPAANQGQLMDAPRGASVQAGLGGVTTSMGGQTHSAPAVSTFNTADLVGGHSDFLGTARNSGIPARGNLQPSSVVTFQGMEVDLATLEALGEVKRTATGYETATPASNQQAGNQPQQQHQAQQQNTPDGLEAFPAEVESAFANAIDPVPQAIYDQSIARVLEGGLESININEIAALSGMSPAEAQQRAEFVVQAFTMQADQIAKAQGIETPAEVWEWAKTEQGEKFADARRQLAFTRNTAPLRSLVDSYFREVPPTVEALKRGGFNVRQDTAGNTVFNLNGNWMTPEAAARAGLI